MAHQTTTGRKPTPAIVREYSNDDRSATVVSEPTNTVTFTRGMGDSGYKVQVVEHDCPDCAFDRMIRRVDVSPVRPSEVRYWCLNPNCVHFVGESLSHAMPGSYPQRDTDEPVIFE